jgi:hypothetical protein
LKRIAGRVLCAALPELAEIGNLVEGQQLYAGRTRRALKKRLNPPIE